ncbi:CidA/LrgA family protein [Nocardioides sp.]|uniref:CidA/LrgA family protein n=1 Tax=Nocardioides sp. TaxID=35761 RepID=UPI0035655E04
MPVIIGLTWLLVCQFVGEIIVRLTHAPLPGPVVGLVLLFLALRVRDTPDEAPVVRTADALLRHLQLLFVPAGVGVVVYLGTLRADAAAITAALLVSWVVALAVVGWVTTLMLRGEAR